MYYIQYRGAEKFTVIKDLTVSARRVKGRAPGKVIQRKTTFLSNPPQKKNKKDKPEISLRSSKFPRLWSLLLPTTVLVRIKPST